MPRLNELGDVCGGVGIVSINKQPVAISSNNVRWGSNDNIVYQCYEDYARVQTYNKTNGVKTNGATGPVYFLSAGGNQFIARGNTLYGSVPNLPINGGPSDTGFDGYSLLKESYQDDLPGKQIWLMSPSGQILNAISTPGTNDWCIRNKDTYCWWGADGVWYDINGPLVMWPGSNVRLVKSPTAKYLLYNGPQGLIFHLYNDKSRGYILNTSGATYNPDGVIINDALRYTYATAQNEAPETIQVVDIPLTTPFVSLTPQLPEPNVEPYDRQVAHFAYFTLDADKGYGDHYNEVMHACWCATESDVFKANAKNFQVIANKDVIYDALNPVMVIVANDYAGAPPLSLGIEEALPACKDLNVGMLIVDDGNWETFPSNIPENAVLLIKAYRNPNESIITFVERIGKVFDRIRERGYRFGFIMGCDDRLNTLTELQIIEAQEEVIHATERFTEVEFIGVFSYARANAQTGGGIIHPTAWRWAKASFNASQKPIDWTRFRLGGAMKKPEVTVDKWTLGEMKNGNEFVFYDRENPDLDYKIRVWIENGSMYASIENKIGSGRTGAYRGVHLQ